jgi:serine/threonine protein kinase
MLLLKGRNKKRVSISGPGHVVHTLHGTHDEITQKLQGLPPEWVQVLRESGVIGEDLVLERKRKGKVGGPYGNRDGIFIGSRTSLVSNHSLQRLWRGVSGKSRKTSVDEGSSTLSPEDGALAGTLNVPGNTVVSPSLEDSLISLSLESERSPSISRQSTLTAPTSTERESVEQIARECGIDSGHQNHSEINPNVFEVVDSLGHGSLGVVEETRVSPKHRSFVRKRVQVPYYKRKQYLRIINQEAHVLRTLSHTHIVKLIGSYSEVPDSGRQFYSLLMAPVGQRDLKTFLDMFGDKSTTYSSDWYNEKRGWLQNWFRCLSAALAYIHSQGVRHQDIKPSNIIHREERIYFTDFSSASQFQIGHTTSTENPARTSAMYAAPEVAQGEQGTSRHGCGTDIFALGAVFAEMLTVYRGISIDEYHQVLLKPREHTVRQREQSKVTQPMPPSAPRSTLRYSQKLEEIQRCFSDDAFFNHCISSMLDPDRDRRPDANDVALRVRSLAPWATTSCACDENPF